VVGEKTERRNNHVVLNAFALLGTSPQVLERDGYDYVDLRSSRSLEPKTPNSFGGVSGSGLWGFTIAKYPGSRFELLDFQLAGVAFYQMPETEAGIVAVRYHRPRSIYERFLPEVRNWLLDSGCRRSRLLFSHAKRQNPFPRDNEQIARGVPEQKPRGKRKD
jgi:hypothetical protein